MAWTRWLGTLGLMLALAVSGASLTGCEQDAGDHFEDAAESAGEGVDQATDDVEDELDD